MDGIVKKINIAATPPLLNQELADLGDFYFVLAQHYLDDDNYRKFFDDRRAKGDKYIILDNGAGDGEQVSMMDLGHATRMLKPDEVIPIDIIGDAKRTYEQFKLAEWWVPKDVKILACPQGETIGDYINCYNLMSNHPRTSRMAISKIAATSLLNGGKADDSMIEDLRPKLFSALATMNMVRKKIHLLGIGSLRELRRYNYWVTSADSCLPIWAAINGEVLDNAYRRKPTPKNYFQLDFDNDELAKRNVHNLQDNIWRDNSEYTSPTKEEVEYRKALNVIADNNIGGKEPKVTDQLDLFS